MSKNLIILVLAVMLSVIIGFVVGGKGSCSSFDYKKTASVSQTSVLSHLA